MTDETPEQKLQKWRERFANLQSTLPDVPLSELTLKQLAELQAAIDAARDAITEREQQQ